MRGYPRDVAQAIASEQGSSARALGHAVVVHYHEIGLKGRNRGFFERRLVDNLTDALEGCEASVEVLRGRLLVHTSEPPSEAVLGAVGSTFGVAVYAPCLVGSPDLDAMGHAALELISDLAPTDTFAVSARRSQKDLPFTSHDVNVRLGDLIREATGAGVDLDRPDATVYVEAMGDRSLVYVDRRGGPGGLPVGVSGRVVSLLSGGIDSPVATYRLLRRGAKADLCHFHSAPFTDRSSARKAEELAEMIAAWQGRTTLWLVAFGEAQQGIVLVAPPKLRVVLYRRFMVRIAAALAERTGAQALVSGDSLGQVASQTMDNMRCTEDASPLPLLRPLIGDDKQGIVDEARRIGTYETSILPYEDCCTLFVPGHPETHGDVEACRAVEAELDVDELVGSCVEGAEEITVERPRCGGGTA